MKEVDQERGHDGQNVPQLVSLEEEHQFIWKTAIWNIEHEGSISREHYNDSCDVVPDSSLQMSYHPTNQQLVNILCGDRVAFQCGAGRSRNNSLFSPEIVRNLVTKRLWGIKYAAKDEIQGHCGQEHDYQHSGANKIIVRSRISLSDLVGTPLVEI